MLLHDIEIQSSTDVQLIIYDPLYFIYLGMTEKASSGIHTGHVFRPPWNTRM